MFGALTLSVSLLAATAADPLVRVDGSSECPLPAAVAERLMLLLPPRPTGIEPDRAEIEPTATGARLVLRLAAGGVVGEKELSGGSCRELTEAAALVIAIWERPLRPGLVPELPDLPGPDITSVQAPVEPPSPPPSPPVATSRERDLPKPRRTSPSYFDAGFAVRGHAPGPMLGAAIEGRYQHRSGWGARLGLGGSSWRDAALEPGRVAWGRVVAEAGLFQAWRSAPLFFEVHERFLASLLIAKGDGFETTRSRAVFDPGVEAAVRAGRAVSTTVQLWLELAGAYYPVERSVRVHGLDSAIQIPRFDSILSLGVSLSPQR